MQFHVPEYIRTLKPYIPGKPIEETQRELGIRKIVKLASNENPLGPSPKAVRALKNFLKELHRYPDSSAYRLKARLCDRIKVKPEQLITGSGSNEIIDLLIRTYCVTGDTIVTSRAAFVAYRICAQIHGVNTIESDLDRDLCFDVEKTLDIVKSNQTVKIVFIANPNNPTGTYISQEKLTWFLDEMQKIRDGEIIVVVDSAYQEYVRAKDMVDPLKLLDRYSNLVVLRTFSKIYGLAGLRVGYGVGHSDLIDNIQRIRQPFNTGMAALVAAEAALNDTAFVQRSRKVNASGIKEWEKKFKQLGLTFYPSQGNFLLVNTWDNMRREGSYVYQECLKRGVILRPVDNYGLVNHLRVSIGTPAENKVALKVFEEVMTGVKPPTGKSKRKKASRRKK